jgi:Holliday junction resolvase
MDMADNIQRKHLGAHNELLATIWLLNLGYDVFRNVSSHGLADIIAMKDGQLYKFDVKATSGTGAANMLSEEQVALDVKLLRVFPNGTCVIDWNPLARFVPYVAACVRCGISMVVRKPNNKHIFCSSKCRVSHHLNAKKTTLEPAATSLET